MKKEKENALFNFVEMIKKSWTYDKLSEKEKENLFETFNSFQTRDSLKGSYEHRWEILHAIYNAFLQALDYKPINWREK